jgi:hypothetical protein
VNLLSDNTNIRKKNMETLIDSSKEVGLEVNTEKIKYSYMLLSRRQNAGQNRVTKIVNRRLKNVAKFRYLGTTIKKSKLDSGGN